MPYVDGFLIAVPTDNLAAYKKIARTSAKVFREHGALSVVECWGDDTPKGKVTSFPRAVKLKDDETVVFSWITYKDKRTRDAVMKKAMSDPRMKFDPGSMPFDGKRIIFGGFKTIIEA